MVQEQNLDMDSCDPESFSSLWSMDSFAPPDFLKGLDKTSLLGSSMSVADKHFVVSASGFDIFGGVVYVFDLVPPSKYVLKKVLKSPLEMNSNFGSSVAVYKNTLLVGANQYSLADGIVIVYKYLEDAYWRETARIKSPFVNGEHDNIWRAFNPSVDKSFGNQVALHGSFAIIATAGNSAFIYEEQPNLQWTMNTRLKPLSSSKVSNEGFGFSVTISAEYAIVGSPNYDGGSGCIYVYQYNSGLRNDSWVLLDRFQPQTGLSYYFGSSLDISKFPNTFDKSTLLAVGAKGFGKGAHVDWNPGYVYMYSLDQDSKKFVNETVLESPVGHNSLFGASVALYDNVLAVGAEGFPCGAANGAGFVYYRQPSSPLSNNSFSWVHNSSFESPSKAGSHFGHAVVLNDLMISYGAYGDDDLRGALYLYERLAKYDISITFGHGGSPSNVQTPQTAPYSVQFPWMILIIIVAATMFCCGSLGMIVYCCCCIEPAAPPSKKKKGKKKGDEDPSPYTIHSYRGYVDSDDEDAFTIGPNGEVIKKDGSKVSKKGSYKVYGPGGFEGEVDVSSDDQDKGAVRKKVETAVSDSDSASATSDSESSMDEFATVPKSIHSMRSSLTAGSSYYSNASSTSYVEQAKAKHRQIKDYTEGSASIVSSGVASKVSFVEQGRAKLLLYKKDKEESMRSASAESDDASKVSFEDQTKDDLDVYKKDGDESMTAAESDSTLKVSVEEQSRSSLDLHKKDTDESVSSSSNDTKSNPLIEQAKAKLQFYKNQSVQSVSESDTVSTSSLSFVEQARARLKSYQRAAEVSSSKSSSEESTSQETNSKSDYTLANEPQTAKYAEARRASSSLASDQEALVTKAKARYQALRTISSSGSSLSAKEPSVEAAVTGPEETVKSETADPST